MPYVSLIFQVTLYCIFIVYLLKIRPDLSNNKNSRFVNYGILITVIFYTIIDFNKLRGLGAIAETPMAYGLSLLADVTLLLLWFSPIKRNQE